VKGALHVASMRMKRLCGVCEVLPFTHLSFVLCVLVCWNEGRCEFIGIVRVVCIRIPHMNS
jgi:hypothetical protein